MDSSNELLPFRMLGRMESFANLDSLKIILTCDCGRRQLPVLRFIHRLLFELPLLLVEVN